MLLGRIIAGLAIGCEVVINMKSPQIDSILCRMLSMTVPLYNVCFENFYMSSHLKSDIYLAFLTDRNRSTEDQRLCRWPCTADDRDWVYRRELGTDRDAGNNRMNVQT